MDFMQALATKVDTVEKPAQVPPGIYVGQVKKIVFGEVGKNKEWKTLDVLIRLIRPESGVDMELLKEFGELTENVTLRKTFMVAKEASQQDMERFLWNVKQFLTKTLGIPEEGKDFKQMLDIDAVGKALLAEVVWVANKNDPSQLNAQIDKVMPVAG